MATALETAFTKLFGLGVPLVQAPMASVAGPALVAGAASAGALAILPIWHLPLHHAQRLIEATAGLTSRPFAVNVRADLVQLDLISAALDAGVSTINLFWGDPAASMAPIRAANARLVATVWSVESAARALDAGASAVIAQGVGAGGHVRGTTPLTELLPMVRDLAGHVPVAAAGGITDAEDVLEVMKLGATAAVLGTRLVATVEADAHDGYKSALVAAGSDTTVLSTCFDGEWPDAPHRTLSNSTFRMWDAAGRPAAGSRPGEGDQILDQPEVGAVPRYSAMLPTRDATGDWEAAALYAGTGVAKVTDVRPVQQLIAEIAAELATNRV